jgi:UDP-N-acetylmuramyl pentapeptide phosphotransferase/UDP-N-acetylglucosamine-1-phosphate transferase
MLAWMLLAGTSTGTPMALAALGLAAVAVVGAWDDHASLPASRRLLVHVLAGCAIAASLVHPGRGLLIFVAIAAFVTVLVNVWNFMDGIDGIAASQAVIAAGSIAAVTPGYSAPAIAVAAASLAFLPFNFPRARIFLGDVGSGALGLAVAWLYSGAAARMGFSGTALVLALPLSAFLVDATLTLARRVLRGERWWQPHSQHLYQGLARRLGHVPVTLAYAAWTLAASVLMIAIRGSGRPFIMASLALCYTTAALLWFVLQRRVASGREASEKTDT